MEKTVLFQGLELVLVPLMPIKLHFLALHHALVYQMGYHHLSCLLQRIVLGIRDVPLSAWSTVRALNTQME